VLDVAMAEHVGELADQAAGDGLHRNVIVLSGIRQGCAARLAVMKEAASRRTVHRSFTLPL